MSLKTKNYSLFFDKIFLSGRIFPPFPKFADQNNNQMINFYNITDRENQEYYEALEVYKAGTPDELQLKEEVLHNKMDSGNAVIIMAKQNIMPAFIGMLWKLEGTHFMVNEIISIIPSFQHISISKMYFDVLKHSKYYKTHHILFEVEDPDFGNKEERLEKLNYYFSHGFQWIKNVKTIVPHPLGDNHENTILLVLTQNRFIEFSKEEIKNLIIKLYKDLYHTEKDSYIVKEILNHLPEKIELTGKY